GRSQRGFEKVLELRGVLEEPRLAIRSDRVDVGITHTLGRQARDRVLTKVDAKEHVAWESPPDRFVFDLLHDEACRHEAVQVLLHSFGGGGGGRLLGGRALGGGVSAREDPEQRHTRTKEPDNCDAHQHDCASCKVYWSHVYP